MKYVNAVRPVLFCVFSVLVLFSSFFKNVWHVADQEWFENFQLDTESLIVGRMVQSRQSGLFSMGGLPGMGSLGPIPQEQYTQDPSFQSLSYFNGATFESYLPYESQIGGQGMLFSLLDKFIPLPHRLKLGFFHALSSLLTALVITGVLLWFCIEFGYFVGLFLLISTILSPWLAVFGKNLWWSIWAFFLPMVALLFFLRKYRLTSGRQLVLFGILVFLGALSKFIFNGYEYVTTFLLMTTVPFVFYAVLSQFDLRRLFTSSIVLISSSLAAILVSIAILVTQIASVEGSIQEGIDHLVFSFEKRSYGDASLLPGEYAVSLNSNLKGVLITYLNGTSMDFRTFFPVGSDAFSLSTSYRISYRDLIVLFGIVSALALLLDLKEKIPDNERQKKISLVVATWFSFLAPLSWFAIFKAHSFVHTHMNFVAWQMPFTIFGFALTGFLIRYSFVLLTSRKHKML